jgi:hypothetical protein
MLIPIVITLLKPAKKKRTQNSTSVNFNITVDTLIEFESSAKTLLMTVYRENKNKLVVLRAVTKYRSVCRICSKSPACMHNRRAQCGKKATREAAKTAATRASTAAAVLMRPSQGVTKSSPAAKRSCRGHAACEHRGKAACTQHSPWPGLAENSTENCESAGRQRRRRVAIFAAARRCSLCGGETRAKTDPPPTNRPPDRTDRDYDDSAINRSCRLPLALGAATCNCGTHTRLWIFYWLL